MYATIHELLSSALLYRSMVEVMVMVVVVYDYLLSRMVSDRQHHPSSLSYVMHSLTYSYIHSFIYLCLLACSIYAA